MIATLALGALLSNPWAPTAAMAASRGADIYTTWRAVGAGGCRETTPYLAGPGGEGYRVGRAVSITAGYVAGTYLANRLARRAGPRWARLTALVSYGAAVPTAWETARTMRNCRW